VALFVFFTQTFHVRSQDENRNIIFDKELLSVYTGKTKYHILVED
jgi:hypothetical protein